ncbi:hypothetical protein MIND_00450000 [Mycena indigotica]|uniref:Las1-domain-containing protein n=1 Tax=Mycena indigotica TaxID=2126181 RepID=A0A8H6W6E0_9AGAR|nr:uncharacterized protein MIND_00450000 [Mycena indigotica]KAF7306587.1 hypothetical protein MIND_00450000 [Mycena indigotica]
MRLPRRVPWASIAELDQVCAWIYTDETDIDAKNRAINRLSAWKSITALPHALDATLALLSVLVQDSQPLPSYLSLRHSYAAALIRLVNGLVDPLQRGLYARSIASIATQLGLPAWLVELRHAATHEDLPSLELLRQAARESMVWLLHNYFLPTINPSAAPAPKTPELRPLAPLLKEYKSLSKLVSRDATLKTQQQQIKTVLRDVERWIAEATVAANVAGGNLGWSDDTFKEHWALDRLSEALLDKSGLVPLSKKKRTFPKDEFKPPPYAVTVWSGLLREVAATHPDLQFRLTNRIITHLTCPLPEEDIVAIAVDTTYDECLARWAFWILENLPPPSRDAKKDALVALITGLGPATGFNQNATAARSLMNALCAGDVELEHTQALFMQLSIGGKAEWSPDDIVVMQDRLEAILGTSDVDISTDTTQSTESNAFLTVQTAPGWQLLGTDSNWKPCPIGVYAR